MFLISRACSIEAVAVVQDCSRDAATAPQHKDEREAKAWAAAFEREDEEDEEGEGTQWRPEGSDVLELVGSTRTHSRRAFELPRELYGRLHPYQRAGVAWMARLYEAGKGGVLADDMGLGKTVQVCAFLHGLRVTGATHALVLLPVTLIEQWRNEAQVWCPEWPLYVYHGSMTQRITSLRSVMRPEGGALLTTYSLFTRDVDHLSQVIISKPDGEPQHESRPSKRVKADEAAVDLTDEDIGVASQWRREGAAKPWDVVVCDEAHKLKNIGTLLGRSVRSIRARCRVLLTGTPVQNALQDLWSLMDFAQPGLLGNHATFMKRFSGPITQGSVRNASPFAAGLKKHLSEQLWQLISPHLLRRTKMSVGLLAAADGDDWVDCGQRKDGDVADTKALPPKTETVIWLLPTQEQVKAYRKILESDVVHHAASTAKMGIDVFRAIGVLKRLCNHPALTLPAVNAYAWADFLAEARGTLPPAAEVVRNKVVGGSLGAADTVPGAPDIPGIAECFEGDEGCSSLISPTVKAMLQKLPCDRKSLLFQSSKLRCLAALLPALEERGHRTLVFSQGAKMLDLIELCVLGPLNIRYLRIDGQTDVAARAQRVNDFQTLRETFSCMLLTTGVGSVGLNLTGADRVVLVDPAWNPAVDAQAVDRVFRIGQEREVRVYRLVMSGLIEDKMFRLQVFKMSLTRTALEAEHQRQYFTSREVRGLFDWTEPAEGVTRRLLAEKRGLDQEDDATMAQARDDGAGDGWLQAGPAVGLSNFSALFSALKGAQQDACNEEMDAIKQRLGEADKRVHTLEESHRMSTKQVHALKAEFEMATQKAAQAAAKRARAETILKTRTAELEMIRRLDPLFKQRHHRAVRARTAAQEKQLHAEQAKSRADEEAAAVTSAARAARELRLTSEQKLRAVAADVELGLASLDDRTCGNAANQVGTDAAVTCLRSAKRAFQEICDAFDAVDISQSRLENAQDGLLKLYAGAVQASATSSTAQHVEPVPDRMSPAKPVVDAGTTKGVVSSHESECARLKSIRDEALRCLERARQEASELVPSALKAGLALVDRAARDSAAAAFQELPAAWDAVKASQQAWVQASELCLEPAQRVAAIAEMCSGAVAEAATADTEYTAACTAIEARRVKRVACETDLEAAEAAQSSAEAEEGEWKRKREALMPALGKQYLETLRGQAAAEKAAAGRSALHTQCSKAAELRQQMEVAKSAAVEALQAEEYDAKQVEEAYHAKKKHRVQSLLQPVGRFARQGVAPELASLEFV